MAVVGLFPLLETCEMFHHFDPLCYKTTELLQPRSEGFSVAVPFSVDILYY